MLLSGHCVWLLLWGTSASLLGQLQYLDQQLQQSTQNYQAQQRQYKALEHDLTKLQAQLQHNQQAQIQSNYALRRRWRYLTRFSYQTYWWDLLLQGKSPFAAATAQRALQHIAKGDQRGLEQHQMAAIAMHKLQQQVRSQQAALRLSMLEGESKRRRLQADLAERQQFAREVSQKKALAAKLAQETSQAQKRLQHMLGRLHTEQPHKGSLQKRAEQTMPMQPRSVRTQVMGLRGSLRSNRGKLPWPAEGNLRLHFGAPLPLEAGVKTTHSGWDIGAAEGSLVQAIAPGKVVYTGWLQGYGKVVIVDHHDAYHSVMAHLGEILCHLGDEVSFGEPIGLVGDTGSLRGSLLYFELRYRSVPIDPKPFLRA